MTSKLRYITFNTDMGWVGILSSEKGIRKTTLPQTSAQKVQQMLGNLNDATWAPRSFDSLIQRFQIYFSGYRVTFPDQLDLSGTTTFQRKVWEITRIIPYGETRSYTWVAEQIGQPRAMRAAGQALGKNPLPIIIPCHRVIASNGELGGFGGGVEMKRRLLSLEGAITIG